MESVRQVALVTGCSTGFGEAIALGLSSRDYTVIATMRSPEKASDALRSRGVVLRKLDVTDEASRRAAVGWAFEEYGRIDVLVNNAGIATRGSVEDTPEDAVRAVMETNFFAPLALIQSVIPAMRRQRSGRIVNVTAIGALLCSPFLSAYCASKHAMDAVTAAMDVEVKSLGIRVSSVLPGQFKTAIGSNMTHAPMSADYAPVSEVLAKGFKARAGEASADLGPVVEAVVAAITDPDPRPRYVVGGGSANLLPPVIAELESIHRIELERARLV
jgi:NAD(P)-dependent dehydrogenase (short-subunit alcohol dehydrogenase family)